MVAQSILLLNASYEPLTVVTLARAVKLLLRGRVEAVSDERITVASAAETLAVPHVLRLKIYARVPHRRTPAWTCHGVFERDDYTCALLRPALRRTRSHGGSPHTGVAGRGLHLGQHGHGLPRCNQRKADRTPHEAGMKLLSVQPPLGSSRRPRAPATWWPAVTCPRHGRCGSSYDVLRLRPRYSPTNAAAPRP